VIINTHIEERDMSKKTSKSKARRKPRAARPEIIRDPALPLLSGVQADTPRQPKPLSLARRKAWQRDRAAWIETQRAAATARRAARAQRMAQRPAAMRDAGFRLPADVAAFLRSLFQPGHVQLPAGRDLIVDTLTMHDELQAAYMEGCRQGYIEGLVVDIEPKRERSRKANAARRQKHGLDERDAEIVAKYRRLRAVPLKAGESQFRLSEEYGLSDKMIRVILTKANRTPQ
jgi:hypothetical protein